MTFSKSSALFTIAATLGIALPASAAPTLFPRAGNRLSEVTNNTFSTVLADTGDTGQLYVLPPANGGTTLSNVFFSANTGFCQELITLQSSSEALAARIGARTADLEAIEPERQRLLAELSAARENAAALREGNQAVKAIFDMRDAIEDLTFRIDELRDQLLDCDTDSCEEQIQLELDDARAERTQLRAEVRVLERTHREALQAAERAQALVEAKLADLDDLEAQILRISTNLVSAKNLLWDMYRQYGQLEGGFGGVEFNTGWDASIARLRADNAGKGFRFDRIDTRDVRVYPQLLPGFGADNYLSGLPAVMAYTVNGQEILPDTTQQHLASFPAAIVASMRLSLIGACPLKDPASWDLAKDQNGVPLYGLHAGYSYPVAFRTNVRVTLNLWRVYEFMKTVSSSGGFFRTRTRVWQEENTDEGSRWTFDFFDESGLNAAEQDEIKQQIKWEIMADVLREMAVPSTNSSEGTINPLPMPESAAVVFANGLDRTCGWYSPYCTGASWILRGLNAVFGGSVAETRYRSTNDRTLERVYSTDAVQYRSGNTAFTR